MKDDFEFYWETPQANSKGVEKKSNTELSGMENTIPINISETFEDITITAKLDGFTKKDVDINVSEESVEITVLKKKEKIESKSDYLRKEISSGRMKRYFALPSKIIPKHTKAILDKGMLKIFMKKQRKTNESHDNRE